MKKYISFAMTGLLAITAFAQSSDANTLMQEATEEPSPTSSQTASSSDPHPFIDPARGGSARQDSSNNSSNNGSNSEPASSSSSTQSQSKTSNASMSKKEVFQNTAQKRLNR